MTHPQRYLGVAVKRVTIVAGLSVTKDTLSVPVLLMN